LDPGWYVNSQNPPCGDRYGPDAVKLVARAIAAYYTDGASEVDGEYSFERVFQKVDGQLSGQGGAIADAWRQLHNVQDRSRCQLTAVHVPVGPDQIRLVTAAMHESGQLQGSNNACFQTPVANGTPQQTSGLCPVGWSAMEFLDIQSTADGKGSVISVMAKNWSADRTRWAALHVWYGPPASTSSGPGLFPGGRGSTPPRNIPYPPTEFHYEYVNDRGTLLEKKVLMSWSSHGDYWIETSNDGRTSRFKVAASAVVDGNVGVVVRREDDALEVFIPFLNNRGEQPDWLRQRGGNGGDWAFLGRMLSAK
jgi:hypothetical protein